MSWLYLLLAIAAFAVAFKTGSTALMVIALLAGLALLVAWLMGVLASRLESRSGNPAMIVDPMELQRMREQAEARRAAAANGAAPPAE
ncbi:hypothetical protein DWG18_13480 [Lysobacter sp. TY2-98]|uniref:hypothetical protein n=1 Tax=Lysobacter sp. TY2-98 TaxID=2290922 RepID=UPI000E1FFC14|nr:hypothetical protein [Lysobacter sp. TY2-98]AXK73196.1 hypothetical protein DWG18_13480 [Lysobacter sp. TY2-98]